MEEGKLLRKIIRRKAFWYQLAVLVLVCVSVLFAVRYGKKAEEVVKLQAELAEQYRDRYEEGYADAEDIAYDAGYDKGQSDGYSNGYDSAYAQAALFYGPEFTFFRGGACLVTQEGYRYHHYGCSHLSGHDYWIYNTELAEYKGYSPCLDCWEDGLANVLPPRRKSIEITKIDP